MNQPCKLDQAINRLVAAAHALLKDERYEAEDDSVWTDLIDALGFVEDELKRRGRPSR